AWQAVLATRAASSERTARGLAEKAEGEALADRERARAAERQRAEQLFQSQSARAEALRWGGKAGRRIDGLRAVADAARLARERAAAAPARLKQVLGELRNQAVACLALADLAVAVRWQGHPPGTTAVALDPAFRRYATADGQGHVVLSEVP